MNNLYVKILPHGEDLPLPSYATRKSAGLDLYSAHSVKILPHRRVMVPTGLSVQLPPDTVGYVHAKSGRAKVEGLALPHGTGVLDEDYRGELVVLLWNSDPDVPITITRGEKIAQLVVVPVVHCTVTPTEELSPTERDQGGFGSTGR